MGVSDTKYKKLEMARIQAHDISHLSVAELRFAVSSSEEPRRVVVVDVDVESTAGAPVM